jgi:eukaryotic-like serine/threonine-protein kinase
MPLAPGTRLDAYELLRPLGAGGMGEVWLATDVRLGRKVAIKLLPEELTRDPTRVRRFEQEARTASSLNHPNVCTILSLGDIAGGQHYLAMEFVEGQTLRQRLAAGPMPLSQALDVARQITTALHAAHQAGIVHRDIKPENVMLRPDGLVKVLDFGLAKLTEPSTANSESQTRAARPALTESGVVMGTVAYMSPEQARGEHVDARTDLFALGAVLYEMVTARRAFPRAYDWTRPPDSDVPVALRPVVFKLLAADANARYQTAAALLDDLKSLEHKPGGHRRLLYASLATAALLTVVALVVALRWSSNERPHGAPQNTWVKVTNLPDYATQPAVSADGRMLAFIRGPDTFVTPGQIYVKSLPDGEPVQLTHDDTYKMGPTFSPDGLRIAYSVMAGRAWETWVVPVINGLPYRWLGNATGLVWSGPRRILFSELKDKDIHLAAVTADESRANAHDVYVPPTPQRMIHRSYPSPDGQWALVVEMDGSRWLPCRLVPMIGGSPGRPIGPPDAPCTSAAWTPDGAWMFVTSDISGAFHVWRQRFPDGPPEQVTFGVTEEEGLAMDPDGKSVLTSVGQRQSVVWLHDGSGERQISLEGYSYDVKLTPDGKRLCYRVLKGALPLDDPSELRAVDLESGRDEPVLPGVSVTGPIGRAYDISPDGRRVVACERPTNGSPRLWLANLDGQSPPRPIPGVVGTRAVFGANDLILFAARGAAPPLRVALDGASPVKISDEIRGLVGASTRGGWVLGRNSNLQVMAVPVRGTGTPFPVFRPTYADIRVAWGPGQFAVSVPGSAGAMISGLRGKTYVVPLGAGQILPRIPEGGFQSPTDVVSIPGTTVIDSYDVALGPTPTIYAYSRQAVQRNVYRIPIP